VRLQQKNISANPALFLPLINNLPLPLKSELINGLQSCFEIPGIYTVLQTQD